MKDTTIITRTPKYWTCCKDILKLLEFRSKYNADRKIGLYKTFQIDCSRNSYGEIYFLLIEGDEFPIVITEEAANEILNDTDTGLQLANNRWMDRYR